jgi:hypothetical protein
VGGQAKRAGLRAFFGNAVLTLASIVFCALMAELTVRIIDGQSPVQLVLPQVMASHGVDTTGGYLDKLPRAASVERQLFFSDPPPLPNRHEVPAEWLELERQVTRHERFEDTSSETFMPWDMFKAWNSALVGDPCSRHFFRSAPGKLFIYDPPDGKIRPAFRFLPDATMPDGLVTNQYGWRGPPVPFRKAPKTIRIIFVGASTVSEIHEVPFSGPEYLNNWLNLWAAARHLDVRFEVLNAGRESIRSRDIAPIVKQEVAPMRPDLVVYYEGGNDLDLWTVVKSAPPMTPKSGSAIERWLRWAGTYSALARRSLSLVQSREWPRPDYKLDWPPGLDEFDPDITRPDLPVNLSEIVRNLDAIRTDLAAVGSDLSVASFHWLAKDGLVLNAGTQQAIVQTLNITYFPFRYRDLERMTAFENRVFAKYDKVHGLPFIDVAKYMPYDPNLFSDGVHNTPAGVKLRAWIELQQLVPLIEQRLASGKWPQPVPDMPDTHPAFATPPRMISFNCKAS